MTETITAPPIPEGRDLLRDRAVVITAAAGTGIGSAAARRCLEEGASVLISDHHEGRLEATRAALAADHGEQRVAAQVCDVTVEEQVGALLDGCQERFGRFDVLVNNAGLGGTASLLEMSDEQWTRVLDVTLNGTFRGRERRCGGSSSTGPAASSSTTPRSSAGGRRPARPTTPPPRPG